MKWKFCAEFPVAIVDVIVSICFSQGAISGYPNWEQPEDDTFCSKHADRPHQLQYYIVYLLFFMSSCFCLCKTFRNSFCALTIPNCSGEMHLNSGIFCTIPYEDKSYKLHEIRFLCKYPDVRVLFTAVIFIMVNTILNWVLDNRYTMQWCT
jgi:hypothetical protein